VYAAGANGNVEPVQTITGNRTKLVEPVGIALDSSDSIYAANFYNSTVTVYAAGAANNAKPINTIGGLRTGLHQPEGIAIR
jgi:hypothetical protein